MIWVNRLGGRARGGAAWAALAVLAACGGGGGGGSGTPQAPTYEVTYHGNGSTGGQVPVDSAAYAASAVVTVKGNTGSLVREQSMFRQSFVGWNTQPDGGGTAHAPDSTLTIDKADVSLHARWLEEARVGTLAGAPPGANGIGAAARFEGPVSVTRVGDNLYVTDARMRTIRKVVIATGEVSVFAGHRDLTYRVDGIGEAAGFSSPNGITTDGTNLYVADTGSHTIRKIVIATREVTTLAGGTAGNVDGVGKDARLAAPSGIATDGANLYFTQPGSQVLRRVVIATGAVTTLAGTTAVAGSADGTGLAATFNYPGGVATDGVNVYIADVQNRSIRKYVIATGVVSTLAGGAGPDDFKDGVGTAARFSSPAGLGLDAGALYVADQGNQTVRKIDLATTTVSTVAGNVGRMGHADGPRAASSFYQPVAVAVDGNRLFVVELENRTVRTVSLPSGAAGTLAGAAQTANGIGPAASFSRPVAIATDGTDLFIVERGDLTVRKIVVATGEVSTLAGKSGTPGNDNGVGSAARFYSPQGIACDGPNLYVSDSFSDRIRRIVIATGEVTTFAGGTDGDADGTGLAATFDTPGAMTRAGPHLYVVDQHGTAIRRITLATAEVTTLAGMPNFDFDADSSGALEVVGRKLYGVSARLSIVREFDLDTHATLVLAGRAAEKGYGDGVGQAALLRDPGGMASDGANLYVADSGNNVIRKISLATREVSTLAGEPSTAGFADGIGQQARLDNPTSLVRVGQALYVVDFGNLSIRKLD